METIKTKAIIEIVGKPKEHIEQTMEKVVKLIEENEKFNLLDKRVAKVKEIKGLWSTFGDFEIGFSNFEDISSFCFEFMPSSLEIISPDELKINAKEIENFTNDVLTKLHQYDMVVKQMILQQKANSQKKEN